MRKRLAIPNSPQKALDKALDDQRLGDFRRALSSGARLDQVSDKGLHPLYRVFSLASSRPGFVAASLAHFRRHPDQWKASCNHRPSWTNKRVVHWFVAEDHFANEARFLGWCGLGLNLRTRRATPLLSVCAPALVPLLLSQGAPLYTRGSDGKTPMLACLSEWSYAHAQQDFVGLAIRRRQSDMIEAFISAGWSPAKDPCRAQVRLLAGRLWSRQSNTGSTSEFSGLSMLRSCLRRSSLENRQSARITSSPPRRQM